MHTSCTFTSHPWNRSSLLPSRASHPEASAQSWKLHVSVAWPWHTSGHTRSTPSWDLPKRNQWKNINDQTTPQHDQKSPKTMKEKTQNHQRSFFSGRTSFLFKSQATQKAPHWSYGPPKRAQHFLGVAGDSALGTAQILTCPAHESPKALRPQICSKKYGELRENMGCFCFSPPFFGGFVWGKADVRSLPVGKHWIDVLSCKRKRL